jgi:hypothetical protein
LADKHQELAYIRKLADPFLISAGCDAYIYEKENSQPE